ncbi:MAG: hypothetical protein ACYSVY_12720 [Planctomycetota bacterium]|jgi:hypothetical protein
MKLQLRSGTLATVADTATQLTATPYRAIAIVFQCPGDDVVIIGDSGVDWTAVTRAGQVLSDGNGDATTVAEMQITAPGARDLGQATEAGAGYIDLSEIYVDSANTNDYLNWFALCI